MRKGGTHYLKEYHLLIAKSISISGETIAFYRESTF